MILLGHDPQAGVAERHDRYGTGIVGVVLLGPGGIEHPHPGRQGGGHIHHVFTRGDQLLGEQIAVAVGGLDAHRRCGNRSAHANNSLV